MEATVMAMTPALEGIVFDDTYTREQTLQTCRALKKKFAEEFERLRKLVERGRQRTLASKYRDNPLIGPNSGFAIETSSDEFLLLIGGFVLRYRQRAGKQSYFDAMDAHFAATQQAIKKLDGVVKTLKALHPDAVHQIEMAICMFEKLGGVSASISDSDLGHGLGRLRVASDIVKLRYQLELWAKALPFVTGRSAKRGTRKSRGGMKPRLAYSIPVFELILVWEGLTGRPVSSPKNMKGVRAGDREATQVSTEFVRTVLKMIYPNFPEQKSVAKAITAIRTARDIDAKTRKVIERQFRPNTRRGLKGGYDDPFLSLISKLLS
jgi:hypothetical protein